jgi:hypothetical protein
LHVDLLIVASIILFLVVFKVGYWLRRSGAPHNPLLLTVHKLVALGISIYFSVNLYRLHKDGALTKDLLLWGYLSRGLLLASGLIGGVVSLDRPTHKLFGWLHNILPYTAIISLVIFISRLP